MDTKIINAGNTIISYLPATYTGKYCEITNAVISGIKKYKHIIFVLTLISILFTPEITIDKAIAEMPS